MTTKLPCGVKSYKVYTGTPLSSQGNSHCVLYSHGISKTTIPIRRGLVPYPALPERERDSLFLFFEMRLTQAEIGAVMGINQSAASLMIARAIRRLRYISEMRLVNKKLLMRILGKELTLITLFFLRTTSQHGTARELKRYGYNYTQIHIYTRINRILGILKKFYEIIRLHDVKIIINEIEKTKKNLDILRYCPGKNFFIGPTT